MNNRNVHRATLFLKQKNHIIIIKKKLQQLQLILVEAKSTSKCMHEFIVQRSVRSEAIYNLSHRYSLSLSAQ